MSFLPTLFSPSALASTMSSWTADDSMLLAAKSGASLSSAIYSQLDPRMTSAPADLMVAYEQAIYFVALAARRAMREQVNTDGIFRDLAQIEAEAEAARAEVTWLCTMTGVNCPSGGAGGVLQDAIDAVERSGLGSDDVVQITSILNSNMWYFQLKRAAPVAAAALLGVGVGVWWWRSRR